MKFLLTFIVLIALVALLEAKKGEHTRSNHPTWKNHTRSHKLKFKSEEDEIKAFNNYDDVDDKIQTHNSDNSSSFKMGHNEFSTWSKKDHAKHKGSINLEALQAPSNKRDVLPGLTYFYGQNHTFQNYGATPGFVLPASVDWVKSGWNTPVRNQLQCGDCWAFATTASVEAAIWKQNKATVTLSPQQLTDCSFAYGNNGCNGGVVAFAYGYMNDVGLAEEQYYPFVGQQTNCNFAGVSSKPLYKVSKYYRVQPNNDTALMEALVKFGPLPVAIDASSDAFSYYKSGLFGSVSGQCTQNTDHAVLLTGYGVDTKGNKFWTIKNQWGPTWGVNGFMNISRKVNNNCGISSQVFIPVL